MQKSRTKLLNNFFFMIEDFAKLPSTASKLRNKSTGTAASVRFFQSTDGTGTKVNTEVLKYRGAAHLWFAVCFPDLQSVFLFVFG